MRFHEYRTLWSEMQGRLPPHVTEEMFYATAMAGGDRTGNGLVLADLPLGCEPGRTLDIPRR